MAEGDSTPAESSSSPKPKPGSGHGLSKRIWILPIWAWVVVLIGAYLLFRYLHNRASSSSTTGGTIGGANNALGTFGTEGFSVNGQGQIVDNATGQVVGTSGSGSSTTSSTSTTGGWISAAQQALFNLGYNPNSVDVALQDYTAGNQLSPTEYGIVESAIRLIGQPPSGLGLPSEMTGGSTSTSGGTTAAAATPSITPSSPAPSAPPNLSAALINSLESNGETVVDTVYQPVTGTWLYLTNKGGVYTQGGSGFFGSVFDLPTNTFAGRTAATITPLANGGYTITDTAGENYTFGPANTGADYAGVSPGGQPT